MPVICRYRPNRTFRRTYTARDAARVMCYAINRSTSVDGVSSDGRIGSFGANFEQSAQVIVNLARERCGGTTSPRGTPTAAEQAAVGEAEDGAIQEAAVAIEANVTVLGELLDWFGVLVTFLTIIATVLRFVPIPAARLASVGAARLLTRVAVFQGTILARQAANAGTYERIQRVIEVQRSLRRAA